MANNDDYQRKLQAAMRKEEAAAKAAAAKAAQAKLTTPAYTTSKVPTTQTKSIVPALTPGAKPAQQQVIGAVNNAAANKPLVSRVNQPPQSYDYYQAFRDAIANSFNLAFNKPQPTPFTPGLTEQDFIDPLTLNIPGYSPKPIQDVFVDATTNAAARRDEQRTLSPGASASGMGLTEEEIQKLIAMGIDPDMLARTSPANRLINQFGVVDPYPVIGTLPSLPSGQTQSSGGGYGGQYPTYQLPEYYGGGYSGYSGYSNPASVSNWSQRLLQWNINRPKGN